MVPKVCPHILTPGLMCLLSAVAWQEPVSFTNRGDDRHPDGCDSTRAHALHKGLSWRTLLVRARGLVDAGQDRRARQRRRMLRASDGVSERDEREGKCFQLPSSPVCRLLDRKRLCLLKQALCAWEWGWDRKDAQGGKHLGFHQCSPFPRGHT